ncbi:MAG: phosphatase PAP2 family protein [Ignavibacteriaceae bacterium]
MKQTALIITFLISFVTLHAQGNFDIDQNKTNHGLISNINSDATSFYKTSLDFVQSPFHFNSRDFMMTGIIAGVTALSFSLDNSVRDIMKRNHSSSMDNITNVGEKLGAAQYGLALSGILYLGGQFTQEPGLRKTGLMLAEALFLNGITTEVLKVVIGRSRPYGNDGNFDLDFFRFNEEDNSLPSGHTSTAFTIATVLSQRIDNTYATIALYSFAGLTAVQRIYADKHWFSDVVLGAALGTAVGIKVVKLNSEYDDQESSVKMNVYPVVGNRGYGAGLMLSF